MKVFAISDLHLSSVTNKPMDVFGAHWEGHWEKIQTDWKNRVSEQDIVVLAGDLSWAMRMEEAKPDFQQIKQLPGRKIIIKGNHDYWWSSLSKVESLCGETIKVLQNNAVKIENVIFCGCRGWNLQSETEEDQKILEREYLRLRLSLETMQRMRQADDIVVGVMHFPPFYENKSSNFCDLFKEFNVEHVIFGHLHGNVKFPKEKIMDGICYFLTSCDILGFKLKEILN